MALASPRNLGEGSIVRLYGVTTIPRAYLVDGDTGQVIDGGVALRGEYIDKTIEAAIASKFKK